MKRNLLLRPQLRRRRRLAIHRWLNWGYQSRIHWEQLTLRRRKWKDCRVFELAGLAGLAGREWWWYQNWLGLHWTLLE